jgi:Na+/melibiose symporter-like transporter
MKTSTTGIRQVGSLIAGALIGLSMVIIVFAMTATETDHWQIILTLGSFVVVVVGFMLQIVMTAAPRPRGEQAATRPRTRQPIASGVDGQRLHQQVEATLPVAT